MISTREDRHLKKQIGAGPAQTRTASTSHNPHKAADDRKLGPAGVILHVKGPGVLASCLVGTRGWARRPVEGRGNDVVGSEKSRRDSGLLSALGIGGLVRRRKSCDCCRMGPKLEELKRRGEATGALCNVRDWRVLVTQPACHAGAIGGLEIRLRLRNRDRGVLGGTTARASHLDVSRTPSRY